MVVSSNYVSIQLLFLMRLWRILTKPIVNLKHLFDLGKEDVEEHVPKVDVALCKYACRTITNIPKLD